VSYERVLELLESKGPLPPLGELLTQMSVEQVARLVTVALLVRGHHDDGRIRSFARAIEAEFGPSTESQRKLVLAAIAKQDLRQPPRVGGPVVLTPTADLLKTVEEVRTIANAPNGVVAKGVVDDGLVPVTRLLHQLEEDDQRVARLCRLVVAECPDVDTLRRVLERLNGILPHQVHPELQRL
jgi:hypothetical protein